jgi:5-methylcytosine-specific restriction endonuclease McrA
MTAVLLLNLSYEPFQIVSPRKAVNLLLRGSAERVTGTAARFHTPTTVFHVPSVLRLRRYVNLYHILDQSDHGMRWSRSAVFRRDQYTCIYCGIRLGDPRPNGHRCTKTDFTLEHVIPRSRFPHDASANTWENTACACRWCNERKGNRTPTEARMTPLWQPYRPKTACPPYRLAIPAKIPDDWRQFL